MSSRKGWLESEAAKAGQTLWDVTSHKGISSLSALWPHLGLFPGHVKDAGSTDLPSKPTVPYPGLPVPPAKPKSLQEPRVWEGESRYWGCLFLTLTCWTT